MVEFGESDKMIKIKGKMNIYQTLTKSFVVIFHSLFKNFFKTKYHY